MSDAISRRSILQLAIAPALLARTRSQAQDLAPTVSKVYPGPDGKLVYVADEQGNTIHDASHAGYGGGGVPIPTVPVKETIWPVAGDNTDARPGGDRQSVRAAARQVRLPRRGAAAGRVLPHGDAAHDHSQRRRAARRRHGRHRHDPRRHRHRPARRRPPAASGRACSGRGPRRAPAGAPAARRSSRWPGRRGCRAAGRAGGAGRGGGAGFGGGPATLIRIAGAAGVAPKDETKQSVIDEYVPVGARSFKVALGARLPARRHRHRAPHRQPGVDRRARHEHRRARRPLAAVQHRLGSRRHRRAGQHDHGRRADPLRDREALGRRRNREVRRPGPHRARRASRTCARSRSSIRRCARRHTATWTATNYVAEEYYSDENHYSNFVTFDNLKHGWVRNATALHFVTSMVGTSAGSKWITVQDCVSREPISQRRGGRRFTSRCAASSRSCSGACPTRGATRS